MSNSACFPSEITSSSNAITRTHLQAAREARNTHGHAPVVTSARTYTSHTKRHRKENDTTLGST